MERYKELSVAELFEHILKDNINSVYYQENSTGNLKKAATVDWRLNEFTKYKWFKREVID